MHFGRLRFHCPFFRRELVCLGESKYMDQTMAELFWLKTVWGEIFLIPLGPRHLWVSLSFRLQLQDRWIPLGFNHCLKSCCHEPDLAHQLLKGMSDLSPWPVEIISLLSGWMRSKGSSDFTSPWTPSLSLLISLGGQRCSWDCIAEFLLCLPQGGSVTCQAGLLGLKSSFPNLAMANWISFEH